MQDATVIMNLDLPYIYTFPVYDAIEAELKMTERLGKKIAGVISDTQFDDIVLPEYVS